MPLRIAFSTVACPDWTLARVARAAAEWGYQGVELRSMGDGHPQAFASEPAHSDPAKVSEALVEAGVDLVSIATGVRLDSPIFPPVLGWAFASREASVRAAKRAVDLAAASGAKAIRVFPFQIPKGPAPGAPGDTRFSVLRRICDRLGKVCDHARNRDVTVLIENAGDFASAHDLDEIMRRVSSPQLAASYDIGAGAAAGDKPQEAVSLLGDRLWLARLRDENAGAPCQLGRGNLHVKEFVQALRRGGSNAWVVFNWDKAWRSELAGAEAVLPEAAQLLTEWCAASPTHAAAA